MTEEAILKIVKQDYESAKTAKSGIDGKMQKWLDEYNGEPYGNESDGHSKIIVKDIKKAVEWFLPNAIEPFVGKNRIVKLEGITADDVQRANIAEKLLNYQFVRNFDRYGFMYDCFKVGATEGTTVVKCGWELNEETKVEKLKTWTPEQLLQLEAEGVEITINDETQVATLTKRKTVVNRPTARVIKNGKFFIDPSASTIDEADFTVEMIEETMSSLKKAGIYKNLDKVSNSSYDRDDSSVEQSRNDRGRDYGYDTQNHRSGDDSLKKLTMHEYWGNLDINDTGIAIPVVVSWIGNVVIRMEENPYPAKDKPYVGTAFTKTPFMFWGDSLAEFLSDGQFIRSGIMRAMLDNTAQGNNGFKFFRKGALDPVNKRKLLSGIGGAIEINGDRNDMWDGEFNQIPATVFNLFEMIQRDNESLSGVSNAAQGLDSRALSTATSANIVASMGQKRMMEIVRRYSELIKELMRKWISYNKVYLNPQEVIRISGEYIEFTPDDIDGSYDIDINVGVDGIEESKANQITMLMQQIGGLAGTVDPKILHSLLAKLADIWGFSDVAAELEAYEPPPPNEMEMQKQQLEIEKLQAEIDKIKSDTHLKMANTNNTNVTAKLRAYGMTEDTDKDVPDNKKEAEDKDED